MCGSGSVFRIRIRIHNTPCWNNPPVGPEAASVFILEALVAVGAVHLAALRVLQTEGVSPHDPTQITTVMTEGKSDFETEWFYKYFKYCTVNREFVFSIKES